MDYTLSPLAEDDLEEIWRYIAEDSEAAANGAIHKIFKAINLLTKSPLIGRARKELLPGMRSLGAPPYIVFYRPMPDNIEIVRILHGSRDIDGIFHDAR